MSAANRLSIRSANLLYLGVVVLQLVLGSVLQFLQFGWGVVASEALFALLPAVVVLHRRRIPLRQGLRLEPLAPLTALLCVILGFCAYLFTIVIQAVMTQLTGMPMFSVPEGSMARDPFSLAGVFVAMAIAAPVCEDLLMRGVVQQAYEGRHPAWVAILVPAVMFTVFHFSFSGTPGLLVVGVLLGWVVWCTGSVWAGVLLHFGLNAPSAINTLLTSTGRSPLPLVGIPSALAGLAVALPLVWAIRRRASATHTPEGPLPGGSPEPKRWVGDYWPVAAVIVFYTWSTVVPASAVFSGRLPLGQAGYDQVHLDRTLQSRFRILDRTGKPAGEMTCTITPLGAHLRLDCTSRFEDPSRSQNWSSTYSCDTMEMAVFTFERTGMGAARDVRAALAQGRLVVDRSGSRQELAVGATDLLEYEWAWRTQALRPQFFHEIDAPLAHLSWEGPGAGERRPALRTETLHIGEREEIDLPAGRVSATRATLGGQAAWYVGDLAGPARLDDGVFVYELSR